MLLPEILEIYFPQRLCPHGGSLVIVASWESHLQCSVMIWTACCFSVYVLPKEWFSAAVCMVGEGAGWWLKMCAASEFESKEYNIFSNNILKLLAKKQRIKTLSMHISFTHLLDKPFLHFFSPEAGCEHCCGYVILPINLK